MLGFPGIHVRQFRLSNRQLIQQINGICLPSHQPDECGPRLFLRCVQNTRRTQPDPCCWYHGRPKFDPSSGFSSWKSTNLQMNDICRPSHQPDEYGIRPFLVRWVRAQGRSLDTPKMSRATSAFPPKGAPQAINITPLRGGLKPGGSAPWGSRYVQNIRDNRPDPCCWYHGRPKCDPSTGSSWLKSTNLQINSSHNSVQRIYEGWDISINVHTYIRQSPHDFILQNEWKIHLSIFLHKFNDIWLLLHSEYLIQYLFLILPNE